MRAADLFDILRRWTWLIAISAAVVASGFAFLLTRLVPPTYQSTATLLVNAGTSVAGVDLRDVETSEELARAFRPLVTLRSVLELAIERADLNMSPDQLERRLTVTSSINLLEIAAVAESGALAADIANAVADAFIEPDAEGATSLRDIVVVVEPAEVPRSAIAPNPTMNALIAGLLALLAVIGAGFLASHVDDTVKSPQEILGLTGLTTVAQVAHFRRQGHDSRLRPRDPDSEAAEAYRAVRTFLTRGDVQGARRRCILVASPGPGEGRSTTVANLAVAFGLGGSKVVVVDGDLRRPSQHALLDVPSSIGVVDVLERGMPAEAAVRGTIYPGVSVLASGGVPSHPAEVLASTGLAEMLAALGERFDVVLIDSPPALPYTDSSVLAEVSSLVLLVVRQRVTKGGELQAAVEVLAPYSAVITGVVLNDVDVSSRYSKGKEAAPRQLAAPSLEEPQAET